MSDEPQNPIPEENAIPVSPQEPTEQSTENTAYSEPTEALPDALESSPSDFSVKSNDIPLPDSTLIEPGKEPETEEKPRENELVSEPISEPVQAIEPSDSTPSNSSGQASSPQATAQILPNEPLTPEPETKIESNIQKAEPESVPVSNSNTANETKPEPEPKK